ncbi:MAG TPA: HEAT repeat domain-containing protein [Thermoanaerobaculia bacterium]|nr:HEAT repeat domain-containing protein [Thermoanaerobaculia bacterium]HUM31298.1 HEAT repeat domain-containing protein [Thermoanaerobaculia bacterium]HXK69652.1 HEAT repeat domain-containing protein [Thermoanaerobaculia bacterium]
MGEVLKTVLTEIRSHDAPVILRGIDNAARLLSVGVRHEEKLLLMEAISSLYYVDLFDRPDLAPVVDRAVEVLSTIGDEAIPYLVEQLSYSDLKAAMNLARTLGKMGPDAYRHLMEFYRGHDDPYARSMALYALSKVEDSQVLSYFDEVIEAFSAEHQEIRDTAARTIGKFFEHFPKSSFSGDQLEQAYQGLIALVSDFEAPVRSKAVRSLAKMAARGYFTQEQRDHLEILCKRILGDLDFEWDRAYIVRMEAEELMKHLK